MERIFQVFISLSPRSSRIYVGCGHVVNGKLFGAFQRDSAWPRPHDFGQSLHGEGPCFGRRMWHRFAQRSKVVLEAFCAAMCLTSIFWTWPVTAHCHTSFSLSGIEVLSFQSHDFWTSSIVLPTTGHHKSTNIYIYVYKNTYISVVTRNLVLMQSLCTCHSDDGSSFWEWTTSLDSVASWSTVTTSRLSSKLPLKPFVEWASGWLIYLGKNSFNACISSWRVTVVSGHVFKEKNIDQSHLSVEEQDTNPSEFCIGILVNFVILIQDNMGKHKCRIWKAKNCISLDRWLFRDSTKEYALLFKSVFVYVWCRMAVKFRQKWIRKRSNY